jgi:transcriptional regulator with XRE-family HTH domain
MAGGPDKGREPPSVGEAVVILRQRVGLSQSELARRCELHPSHISRIEAGRSEPHWGTLRKIAAAADSNMIELVALTEGKDGKEVVREALDTFPELRAILKPGAKRGG